MTNENTTYKKNEIILLSGRQDIFKVTWVLKLPKLSKAVLIKPESYPHKVNIHSNPNEDS